MRRYRISQRQFGWLIVSYLVTSAIINLPQQLSRIAAQDAWLTQWFPLCYGICVCYVFYRLAKLFPGKNFFEISTELAGKWGGGFLKLIFLLHMWFIFARDSMLFMGFIKTNLLLRTPYEITLLLLFIVLVYYGKTSVEVSARVNDIFFVFLALMVFALPLLLSNEMSITQLEPSVVEPAGDIGLAGLMSASYYGDIVAFAAFLPGITNPKSLLAAFRHGLSLTVLLITWLIATGITVLGADIMAKENFPTYAMVQQIHITDFLDRVEIFEFSIYFPSFVINLTITFFAVLIGLTSFTKSNNYQFYSRSAGLFILLTCEFAFSGTPDVAIFANYGFPVYMYAVQPIGLLILLLLAWRKSKPSDTAAGQRTEQEKKSERSWRIWMRVTHLWILFGLVCIVAGMCLSKDYQWAARICAGGYAVSLFGTVISTYMEQKRSIEQQTGSAA
ncbi:hypothetical protein E5161_00990 [Cohnella pontilimi]|uniref:Spore germination protein (Amino acid permease) n=1 Tax=Cohnella pontilimi TaxID=2564100 RepID=A0A4U0FHT3_9BACL|nr:endospore germination permease [Cohnella pontilimi]TJY44004.1 hypothetical protein E5161_00990 [Cohnella pontilimi]